jgi:hypothetical protein
MVWRRTLEVFDEAEQRAKTLSLFPEDEEIPGRRSGGSAGEAEGRWSLGGRGLATIQMVDVCFPTTDGRWLIMPRYTQPEPEQQLILHRLGLRLPAQPSPRIKTQEASQAASQRLQM